MTESKRLAELAAELRQAGYKVEPPLADSIVNIPPDIHQAVADALREVWPTMVSQFYMEASKVALTVAIPMLEQRKPNVISGRKLGDYLAGRPGIMGYYGGNSTDTRDPECVKRWPECVNGTFDPKCCRWPKSCSC